MAYRAIDTLAQKDRSGKSVSGGHLVAKGLKNEGVDTIFTLCGGHIIDIYDGCQDEGIRIIDVRLEQVAAHAADGYARQTGKLGLCSNHGEARLHQRDDRHRHGVPLGKPGPAHRRSGRAQPAQDGLAAGPAACGHDDAHYQVRGRGAQHGTDRRHGLHGRARSPLPTRRGRPTWRFHATCWTAKSPSRPRSYPRRGPTAPSTKSIGDPADIEKLADLLVKAERPCILLGSQVWTVRGHEAAIALVRGLNLPAYFNGAGRGLLPPGDPHHFHRTRRYAFDKADVIVIVGTPFDFRMGYGKRLKADATVVQIDLDYRTVGRNRDVSLGLVGNPGAILKAVHDAATGRGDNGAKQREGWLDELRAAETKATDKLMPMFLSDSTPIHPYRVAWEINEFLTEDTIYIGDGGDVVTISAQAVQPHTPGHWMDPGALGSLGVGTGFALAAKLAHPEKEVLCYYGDGAFSMTAFDMETANRFGAPYIAVIGNNSAMNQIRYGQIAKYGRAARQRGQQAGRCALRRLRRDAGRLWRRGARPERDRTGVAPRPRGRESRWKKCRDQHLGRLQRIRAGDQGPDHVQVAARPEGPPNERLTCPLTRQE